MAPPLLEALGGLLRRVVAPAVLVALAVARAGETRELVGERALAELLAFPGEPVARAGPLEPVILGEGLEVGLEDVRGHGEEARELRGGRRLRDALGAHPVHGLQDLVADPESLKLVHCPPRGCARARRWRRRRACRGRGRAAPFRRAPHRACSRRTG